VPPQDVETVRVEPLDGTDVRAAAIAALAGRSGRPAHGRGQLERGLLVGKKHQRRDDGRRRGNQLDGHGRDQTQRALRADEQIDQVHWIRGEVASGDLFHGGQAVFRNGNLEIRTVGQPDAERAAATCHDLSPLDFQQIAVEKQHPQAVDPLARDAVLEGRRAARVRRGGAADHRLLVGRHRREIKALPGHGLLHLAQAHTRADRGPRVTRRAVDRARVAQGLDVDHDLAVRDGPAGERRAGRLRQDVQAALEGRAQERGGGRLARHAHEPRRVSRRGARRVLQVGLERFGRFADRRGTDRGQPPGGDLVGHLTPRASGYCGAERATGTDRARLSVPEMSAARRA
jgi:hypothetical protein